VGKKLAPDFDSRSVEMFTVTELIGLLRFFVLIEAFTPELYISVIRTYSLLSALHVLALVLRVQFRNVSPHNFDGLAVSGLAISVVRSQQSNVKIIHRKQCLCLQTAVLIHTLSWPLATALSLSFPCSCRALYACHKLALFPFRSFDITPNKSL